MVISGVELLLKPSAMTLAPNTRVLLCNNHAEIAGVVASFSFFLYILSLSISFCNTLQLYPQRPDVFTFTFQISFFSNWGKCCGHYQ